MNGLSEREWSDVLASLPENPEVAAGWELSLVRRTVERVIADRLASVEALADEWERAGNRLIKKYRNGTSPAAVKRTAEGYAFLRAAEGLRDTAVLGSDAHTEQKETKPMNGHIAENDAVTVPPAFAAYAHKVQEFAVETWVTSKAHEWAASEPPAWSGDLADVGVTRGYRQAQRDLLAVMAEARASAPARVIPPGSDPRTEQKETGRG